MFALQLPVAKRLSKEEELRLFREAKDGNTDSRNHLVMANIGLVIRTVSKYKIVISPGVDYSDLFSMGCIGLIDAIKKFDLARPIAGFSQYAVRCIKTQLWLGYFNNRSTIRLPHHVHAMMKKFRSIVRQASHEGKYNLTLEDLISELSLDENRKKLLFCAFASQANSLSEITDSGRAKYGVNDEFHPISSWPDPSYEVDYQDEVEKLVFLLNEINDWNLRVIKLLYGFDGSNGMSVEDCAEILGVTKYAVRITHQQTLMQLREEFTHES